MGMNGPLTEAAVVEMDDVALVMIMNRRARPLEFEVDGVVGSPVAVSVRGNDVYRGSFTISSSVVIRDVGGEGTILYPLPPEEV